MQPKATRAMAIRGLHSRSLGTSVPRGGEARVAYLRGALLDNRLRLVAQPIVDPVTRATVAEELLLRVVRRNGRVEAPGPYIKAAEQSRLAIEVDTWVLDRAARIAAAEGRHLQMNLSARTVSEGSFADRIEDAINRHGVDPRRLTFEITETAQPIELRAPSVVAERIASLGCGLALDDFGMGYGTLTYLHRLPVTMVKIDREFVSDATTNPRSRAIVDAVVCIASRVGQKTVAEGVEDDATLVVMRECGVDLVQGFHLGRPAAF